MQEINCNDMVRLKGRESSDNQKYLAFLIIVLANTRKDYKKVQLKKFFSKIFNSTGQRKQRNNYCKSV